jgi:hypothetical protein
VRIDIIFTEAEREIVEKLKERWRATTSRPRACPR